jgi:hypothetical protein
MAFSNPSMASWPGWLPTARLRWSLAWTVICLMVRATFASGAATPPGAAASVTY